jgi:hypothetical protein
MRLRPRSGFTLSILNAALATATAFLVTSGGRQARAAGDDDSATDDKKTPPQEKTASPSDGGGAGSAQAAPAPSDVSPGPVERLPPSAYPEPVTRGLYGGSMWMTFHGLQWPYVPRTGVGFSGYAWLDSSYEKINRGDPSQPGVKEFLQQGRAVLRITPTYTSGDWFVQAQAELVANKDQTIGQPNQGDVDDLWIRTGQWHSWDLTVGRYEAFEVYHLGMGLDLNTEERIGAYDQNTQPPGLYGASFLYYRPAGLGDIALHLYVARNLRIELLGQMGNDGGLNQLGGRPALVFDIGWLKVKGAGEYGHGTSTATGNKTEIKEMGAGGGFQLVFEPYVEFGGNFGYAKFERFDNVGTKNEAGSYTKLSYGGFMNVRLVPDVLLGLGLNDVRQTDYHFDPTTGKYGEFNNLQAFAALQVLIRKQLFVKLVGAYGKADFDPSFAGGVAPHSNTMYSGRLRLTYLF